MKFTQPKPNERFTITSEPVWPEIVFQTDAAGAHAWEWTLTWGKFTQSGTASTPLNRWAAVPAIANLGGTLTVRARGGTETAAMTVTLIGTNPTAEQVTQFLASRPNSAGFEKIVEHESKFRHFDPKNAEPVRSFDEGYGMCQLTTPPPGFGQVWNWKMNLEAGLKLFEQKHAAALAYLGQEGRTYTPEQLRFESVCRWNGGSYHVWDAQARKWVRPSNILCDTRTGNIGWDLTDPANKGKTEGELRNRDSASYGKGRTPGAHWRYFGICYADRILG